MVRMKHSSHRQIRPTPGQPAETARAGALPRSIEALEARIAPAGLIDVSFSKGVLAIHGDADNNNLTITETADGRLSLTTDVASTLRINGTDFNGLMGQTLAGPVTGGVTIDLGDGVDILRFNGSVADLELPSFLKINHGNGANQIFFEQGVTVSGAVTINGGKDMDNIHLNDEVNFSNKLTINNGAGGSLIDSNATGDIRVGGIMSVTSGAGMDKIDFTMAQKATLGGFVLKTIGDTDSTETRLSPVESLTINGAVKVTSGGGTDDLDLGDATKETRITGAVAINLGAGNNHTDIVGADSLIVGGPIKITGGADGDLAHVGINSGEVSFGSSVTINLGEGSNGSVVQGHKLDVAGNITISGGASSDNAVISSSEDGTIAGAVKVSLGKGSNSFNLLADANNVLTLAKTLVISSQGTKPGFDSVSVNDVKIQGATTITTGEGNDSISIDDATFNGVFKLATGKGNDMIKIEQSATETGHTVFNRAATIQAGDGDDALSLSDVLASDEQKAIFAAIATFDGGTGMNTLALSAFGANLFYGPEPVKKGF